MPSNPETEDLLKSYLLGALADEEVDVLERRLLEDDDLFDLCEGIEAELLATYDRGELAPEERERVLRRLASSPQGRERLAFARSLNKVADRGSVVPFRRLVRTLRAASRPAFAAIAATLLVAIATSWLLWQRTHTLGAEHSAANNPTKPPTHVQPPPPPPPVTLATQALVLSFETFRGDGETAQKLELSPKTGLVTIKLIDLQGLERHGSFHAAVRSKGGANVWQGDLKAQQLEWGPGLVLTIPADRLAAGPYTVTATAGNGEALTVELKVIHGKSG